MDKPFNGRPGNSVWDEAYKNTMRFEGFQDMSKTTYNKNIAFSTYTDIMSFTT